MFKIDRHLIVVEFVSYVPGEVRMMAQKQGRSIDPHATTKFGCKIWAPWPVDDVNDEYQPWQMKPEEHGVEWAYAEVRRRKPEKMEVLAVTGHQLTNILESTILNQPPVPLQSADESAGEPERKPTSLRGLVEVE